MLKSVRLFASVSASLRRPICQRLSLARTVALRRFSSGTRFTEDHEWITAPDSEGVSTVGITDFAQEKLGEIVYVELPSVGDEFDQGDVFGAIESVKAASDLFLPVSGTVADVNSQLEDTPGAINNSPEDKGWIIKLKLNDIDDFEEMLDSDAYEKLKEE